MSETEYEVYLTEQAENNYKSICAYLQDNLKSTQAKNNFVSAFDKKMKELSKAPKIFQICEYPPLHIRQIRYTLVKQYKAYYIVDEANNRVDVLYIKHCLQNEQNLN